MTLKPNIPLMFGLDGLRFFLVLISLKNSEKTMSYFQTIENSTNTTIINHAMISSK